VSGRKVTEAEIALEDARRLAHEGRFVEALAKHVWFHDHALESNKALNGVRLSFALAYWVKLGEQYPPARQALAEIRDGNVAAVISGERSYELFDDVAALNEVLGDDQLTVRLFLDIESSDPEHARRIYRLAEDSLARSGEYQVCSRHLDDPQAKLRELLELRRTMLRTPTQHPEHRGRLTAYAERRFADDVASLVRTLAETGRDSEADEVKRAALKASNSAALRSALSERVEE
jgi:hypothetical protein